MDHVAAAGARPPRGEERAFSFLPLNRREAKPRQRGLTEVRGPYYAPMGPRSLADLLDTMGAWVDALKFAGGSFALMPEPALRGLIQLCHEHEVKVNAGGFLERVLARDPGAVGRALDACKRLGFDLVEVSGGFLSAPDEDLVRLTRKVLDAGLTPKPEVGVQFGAGGATRAEELEREGARSVQSAIRLARMHLDAGAPMVMVESEGVTESVTRWRTDVVDAFADALGLDALMFEAADPVVFQWYVQRYGPEVNLFVDHSQVVQLEALRSGLWGTKSLWGRVVTYKE